MAFVITQPCCNDASCVTVCPVDCIHPAPHEPDFVTTEMLYIDPATCIDCAACIDACPVEAIFPDDDLEPAQERYRNINAAYYELRSAAIPSTPTPRIVRNADFGHLSVAIVGSGPAAFYTADEILKHRGARVEMYEKLYTPYGLVRAGVAPDHAGTKAVSNQFRRTEKKRSFRMHLGVEVGVDISHADLANHHTAVVYATGASSDRQLGIPGERLIGSHSVSEFVAWYNGHPSAAQSTFDLSAKRAVIVGNGNVALDAARILVSEPERLEATDIADHALEALRHSSIEEVVVLGRRGPAHAGYTTPELAALLELPGVDVLIDPTNAMLDDRTATQSDSSANTVAAQLKLALAREVVGRTIAGERPKRIILRFFTTPVEVLGTTSMTGVRLVHNRVEVDGTGVVRAVATSTTEDLDAGLMLSSIGYRGTPVVGVPFDENSGVMPNVGGRVVDPATSQVLRGVYTTGWIKRGASGVIGTNKQCAAETAGALIDDYENGTISEAAGSIAEMETLVRRRVPAATDLDGWSRIDDAEQSAGRSRGKPRVKLVHTESLVRTALGS